MYCVLIRLSILSFISTLFSSTYLHTFILLYICRASYRLVVHCDLWQHCCNAPKSKEKKKTRLSIESDQRKCVAAILSNWLCYKRKINRKWRNIFGVLLHCAYLFSSLLCFASSLFTCFFGNTFAN